MVTTGQVTTEKNLPKSTNSCPYFLHLTSLTIVAYQLMARNFMEIHHTRLRMSRKQSQLNQADLAFLLGLSDYSNISRWEQGRRIPSIEMLIAYHLLFGIEIEKLFERKMEEICKMLVERIRMLLANLRMLKSSQKVTGRILFLESALVRLTA